MRLAPAQRATAGSRVGQGLQAFKLHVTPLQSSRIALLQEQRADETCDGRFVREDAHDAGRRLNLAFKRSSGFAEWSCLTVSFGKPMNASFGNSRAADRRAPGDLEARKVGLIWRQMSTPRPSCLARTIA